MTFLYCIASFIIGLIVGVFAVGAPKVALKDTDEPLYGDKKVQFIEPVSMQDKYKHAETVDDVLKK